MNKKKFLIIAGLMFLALNYQNCSATHESEVDANSNFGLSLIDQKAQAVLMTRCYSCHSPSVKSGGLDVTDQNYMLFNRLIVPSEPQLSILYQRIEDGSMPPGSPLSIADTKAIADWITDGFKSVTPPPVTTTTVPTVLTPTFASIRTLILNVRCTSCHRSGNAQGGIALDTYQAVRNVLVPGNAMNSDLYTSVAVRNTMPAGAGGSLTAAQKSAIQTWINNGALNN